MRKNETKKYLKLLREKFPHLCFLTSERFRSHTTFGIGGKIAIYVEVERASDMVSLVREAKNLDLKYFILGLGSNILASDKYHDLLVIKNNIKDIRLRDDKIVCGAGVSLIRLNNFAMENALSGLEWSYGIPGSVGGAIKMNSGSFGGEIRDVVQTVYYFDGEKLRKKCLANLDFSYRHSFFSDKNYVILKVVFKLKKGNKDEIERKSFDILKRRRESQPHSFRSAGSVFKRPKGTFAPVLIEQAGLKGLSHGGAEISTKHCGFVINKSGNAKFNNVFWIICKIKETVFKKYDIMLVEEIEILK